MASTRKKPAALSHAPNRSSKAPPAPEESTDKGPWRAGKKLIGGWFDPEVAERLAEIRFKNKKSLQSLLKEALSDLFQKYRFPPID